jgi:ABC-type multidrug transport system fused ATPase/permease subunit
VYPWPPLSCERVTTFWRLLSFLRPYRAGAVWSVVLAGMAMGATVLIPWLTGIAVDAIGRGDRGRLELAAGVVAAAAVVRLTL